MPSKPDVLDGRDGPRELGRYILLRELGRGAIGIVYAAYHEGLDRKLAIKVLNRARAGRADLEARLWREARALAKLSHPNVVQVYDVGELDGRVYVVMEFVEGRTLGEWMRERHELDEILAMFIAAGRGLAAAHAAGVIHRDFKPDNVIVGVDGRPRVLDFGLARAVEGEAAPVAADADGAAEPDTAIGDSVAAPTVEQGADRVERLTDSGVPVRATARELARSRDAGELAHDEQTRDPLSDAQGEPQGEPLAHGQADAQEPDDEFVVTVETQPGAPVDDAILTRTGARVGTPAYMSPEQFLAAPVDHATDQFSFCVALHEAVYGRRPYPGRNQSDLMEQVVGGRILDAPPDSSVPAWLREVILRGLRPHAEDRWPSMNALLAALEQRPDDHSHRRWTIGLATVGVAAIALVIGLVTPRGQSSCAKPEDTRTLVWTSADETALADAFTASGSSYASAAWASVGPRLDRWATSWADEQAAACEATLDARDEQKPLLDRRAACLDRNRRAFLALLAQFREADMPMVEGAVEAVAKLPDPARCGALDDSAGSVEAPPPEHAAEVAELRSHLAELDTRAATGRWESALPLARVAVERARASGYGPVIAEALLTHGRLLGNSGRESAVDEALMLLQDALDEAERSGDRELVPQIGTELVSLSIYAKPDPLRGRLWARRALSGIDRLALERGEDDSLAIMRARSSWTLGNLERLDGDLDSAQQHLREALALLDRHAPSHHERGIMLNDLGIVLAARGDDDGAREAYEQSITANIAAFGEGHPRVGDVHFNLARLEFGRGELERAREQADLAFIIFAAARGLEHRDVGAVEIARAGIELMQGNLDAARERARKAQIIYDAVLAPDNIDRAEPHQMLGHVAFFSKDLDAAMVAYRAALAIKRAALPVDHPELISTLTNLGLVHFERAKLIAKAGKSPLVDRSAAVDLLGQAFAMQSRADGIDPEQLRVARRFYADALFDRDEPGDMQQAAKEFEAGLAGCHADALTCAGLAIGAARARYRLGQREQARDHAISGEAWLEAVDPAQPQYEELRKQLADLGGPG